MMHLASLARVRDGCVRAARRSFLLYTVAEHGLRNIFLICISLASPLSLGDFEISYAFSGRVGPLEARLATFGYIRSCSG